MNEHPLHGHISELNARVRKVEQSPLLQRPVRTIACGILLAHLALLLLALLIGFPVYLTVFAGDSSDWYIVR
jgi:hypothetical protein